MDNINHSSFYTYSKDNTLLHGMFWLPKEEIRAVICLVHGLGGHVARFGEVANFFCSKNIGFVGVDLRGHGKSHGKPGVIKNLQCFYDDIEQAVKYIKRFVGEKVPMYVYGNSMGGPLALKMAIDNQDVFKGAILAAPWFKLVKQPGGLVLKMVKLMGVLMPNLTFSSGIKSENFRTSEEMQEKAKSDPLAHKQISARLFCKINHLGKSLLNIGGANVRFPVIIFHGEKDRVTDIKSSIEFQSKYCSDTEFVPLSNARHEIHVEAESGFMLNRIVDWIFQHECCDVVSFESVEAVNV